MFIIAEAGVNHNGDVQLANQLIEAAARAGADCVKFQTFRTDALVTSVARQAEYQAKNIGQERTTQADMLRRLELTFDDFRGLKRECVTQGIRFLSTPFDHESAAFLIDDLGEDLIKIGSGDFDNLPLLLAIARKGARIILSTGMANLGEIELSLGAIAFGYMAEAGRQPSHAAFLDAYGTDEARKLLAERVTLLHCTTEYPAPMASLNLKAITTMRHAFGVPTGFSDHSEGYAAAIGARMLGATMLEKHFTLDRAMPGPDHKASLEPGELAAMVKALREIDIAMGDGIKRTVEAEKGNKAIARKSPVAARDIAAGETLTDANLTLKRTTGGLPASAFYDLVGTPAQRAFFKDEAIS